MAQFDLKDYALVGPGGRLQVPQDDEITRKLLMLIEGECEGDGPLQAAKKFSYCKQRYFQLRDAFQQRGAIALQSQKRGPKTNYRRTPEVVRQVIRHRFLDPDASPEVIAQKLCQTGNAISIRSVERVIADYGLQKKLHRCRPRLHAEQLEAQITQKVARAVDSDPPSIERGVRQRLADKINDNMAGLWLLVPEHLRLGTWDLLCGWTGQESARAEPRLALQLVHEAALCSNGVRQRRAFSLRGFEVLNGLPFLASDKAIHELLGTHTMEEAQRLQVALGKIRRASGHYSGKLLLIDPHRPQSYSRRHVRRHRRDRASKPIKTAQIFFCLDGDSVQPLCFTQSSSARTVSEATPELLAMASEILDPPPKEILVAADTEHFTADLVDYVDQETPFDILVPIPNQRSVQKRLRAIAPESFTPHWAGYATTVLPYTPHHSRGGPYFELAQRQGERPDQWHFNSFFSTTQRDHVNALTRDYPKRWHAEEFFNFNQALGWHPTPVKTLMSCGLNGRVFCFRFDAFDREELRGSRRRVWLAAGPLTAFFGGGSVALLSERPRQSFRQWRGSMLSDEPLKLPPDFPYGLPRADFGLGGRGERLGRHRQQQLGGQQGTLCLPVN
jgi:hypothetical protein